MKIKTSELKGAALERLVAKCENVSMEDYYEAHNEPYMPEVDWAQGGPIIEREEIGLAKSLRGVWTAIKYDEQQRVLAFEDGSTPLVAAMRCYVASKLGGEVDVPAL